MTETVTCTHCGEELSEDDAILERFEGEPAEYVCSEECKAAVWKAIAMSSRSYI